MDDDFFKDYPPVPNAGGEPSGAIPLGMPGVPAGDGLNPFGELDEQHDHENQGEHAAFDEHSEDEDHNGSLADAQDRGAPIDSDLGGPPPDDAPLECEAVAAWRVAFARGLQEKEEAERRGKAERAEAARDSLHAMHKRWNGQCRAAHDANLVREKELLRDRDGVIARMSKPGEPPSWNVVPELVDMSGKFKEGARDTSRMRQVLLKLKTHD